MKTLRRIFAVSALITVLALSTLAGDITTGIVPPQPAPTPAMAEGEITTGLVGEISTPNREEAVAGDSVVAGAMSVVECVLSLL
ncbi:MAG: hypothetical protein QOE46_1748 [Acidobacteriota bacterium]|jgi:hypothetical protein|nr:hypothetical protein [Acidobacteriota bacterium]